MKRYTYRSTLINFHFNIDHLSIDCFFKYPKNGSFVRSINIHTGPTYGHLTKGLEKKASHQFSELMKDLVYFDTVHDQIHEQ